MIDLSRIIHLKQHVMHPLEELPIYKLSQQFKANPSKKVAWQIISRFYSFYQEDKLEDEMLNFLWLGVTSDNEDVNPQDRVNMLHAYEYITMLNKALYYLHTKHPVEDEYF